MAKAKEQMDIEFKGMPGADLVSEDEAKSFQVNLNFDEVEEEAPPVEEETAEEPVEVEAAEEALDPEPEVQAEAEAEVEAEVEPEAELEAEPEVETQVEAEAEVEPVEVEEKPKKPKAPMVPKSRLDEVLAKNKQMQKQIAEHDKQQADQQAQAPKYDFDVKEQEYQQLVLDGETKKATALRGEIRAAEREHLMFEVQQQTGQTVQRDREAQELSTKAQEIEETFPILNENSEQFNRELAEEVRDLRDAFMVQGFTAADSLAKATEYTLAAKQPELLQPSEDNAKNVTKLAAVSRQKTGVKKKMEASKSQPPALKGESTSQRGDKAPDINVLSDEEFSALPEETLRRMRGDFG